MLPSTLDFAQGELDKLNRGDKNSDSPGSLRNKVSDAWGSISLEDNDKTSYIEDAVGTQLARLAAIDAYLRRKTNQLMSEMQAFKA